MYVKFKIYKSMDQNNGFKKNEFINLYILFFIQTSKKKKKINNEFTNL